MSTVLKTDDQHHREPDPQILDDLGNWGIPALRPSEPDYFPNDALISDEDVPPTTREEDE